ncbi:MAG: cellulase family glycosylhydrolase [Anaerolineae bacterium]|nr:cellulase family glycosylhydrolase [Anaerolineae bacterium]
MSGYTRTGDPGTGSSASHGSPAGTAATRRRLPRWRGFNLLEMFTTRSEGDFQEDDFRWMSEWGFDFARIPMCYTLWTVGDDVYQVDERMLEKVDRVVEYGRTYGVHIDLNFHRAPGYSVNREREEPYNLWQDQAGLDAFCFHWQLFARRYKGIPSDQLSFNLVNEPTDPRPTMSRADHERVIRAAVGAIRDVDPDRLIVVDGLAWGRDALPELADLDVAQSTRAYDPMGITHYQASWVAQEGWPLPTWPGTYQGRTWDRSALRERYAPWIALADQGVGVHCGEGGAFNHTPHRVFLHWLGDVLDILTEAGIGYALWNLRGAFGVVDSGRADVAYEEWHGHQLDRALLDLLQRH